MYGESSPQLGNHKLEMASTMGFQPKAPAYDPEATQISQRVGRGIKRTFEQMCDDNNRSAQNYFDKHVAKDAPQPYKTGMGNLKMGESQVDQSTLDVFQGYNLDTRTMTKADEQRLRTHFLLADDERTLPRYQLVALLKTKMLDEAARMKDIFGPRPMDYSYPNPTSYNVVPGQTTSQRLEQQSGQKQYQTNPGPNFTQPAPTYASMIANQTVNTQPEKVVSQEKPGLLSRIGSGLSKAASALKFWGKK